jgi:anaerobic selenocysteine-containing dehydrogenase
MAEIKPTVCPFDCPDTCGILAKVEGGRLLALRGDPDHPFTRGFLCAKMAHYPERVHSPRRLTRPLKRVGPKGAGQFQAITWDEALDIYEREMNRTVAAHGAQAVLPYSYAGHMGLVHRNAGHAFFHKLGASRLQRTICGTTAGAGFAASLGAGPSADIASADNADLVIVWGSNTLTTNLHAWPFFLEARRKGAQIVVIDPYFNRTARAADKHLMLRPGSDAALALAMMHVIIKEKLVNRRFVADWCVGYEEMAARAIQWPPERAALVCGVPHWEIADLARAYARAAAPYIRTGFGFSRQPRGAMAMRTVALLPALTGALHTGGGGITRTTSEAAPFNTRALTREDLAPRGVRSFNMIALGQALTQAEPPVRFLHVYLSNPAVVAPESGQVLKGLAREDLFTVVHEMFMTETALMADLVLPGTSSAEMTDLYRAYGHHHVQMVRPVIPAVGEGRSILAVFQELARRMGFDEPVFRAGEEEIISWLLATDSPYLQGITLEALSGGRPLRVNAPENPYLKGFATPSGKVEMKLPAWAGLGLDPLPNGEPGLDPEGAGRFPLHLITPPNHHFLNSTFNEVEELRARAGKASLIMHAGDAAARGLAEGDLARVFNDRGSCVLKVRAGQDVLPGVAVAEGLYWGVHTPGGTGINHLTSQRAADLGGSSAFHGSLVEVEKA